MLESLPIIFFAAILAAIIFQLQESRQSGEKRKDDTEAWVDRILRETLNDNYVIFSDLIIPSISKSIRSTQIDHVIVSQYGIFCLETKSHQGNIYGGNRSKYWKQYLGSKSFEVYSPLRQNKHHVRSLEYLLRSRLKAPIHSYIVFPSAKKVVVNGSEVDLSLTATIDRVLKHMKPIYSINDVEAIAKGLAIVSSPSNVRKEEHIKSVKAYIETHKT